ncbi:MAG: hypothetical protein ABI669_08830, partial [Usitatibacter sp.]
WGLWGILLGIPLLAIVKSICERTESLQRFGELLTREQPPKRLSPGVEKNSTPGAAPPAATVAAPMKQVPDVEVGSA